MSLVDRVKSIILSPNSEWPVIDREPENARDVFVNYVAILAAIPAVCGFIGTVFIGISVMGATYHAPFMSGLISAIVSYVLAFVGVYVMALIVDALAPTFSGVKNMNSAVKLVAYSATASWLAGVFALIPTLSFLGLLGLYSLYLLYAGLPVMMKSPREKSLVYTITVIVIAIVIALIIGFIQTRIIGVPGYM
ncbi:MAG: Yip1 family protein [Pseudolabrys sp.]